MNVDWASLQDAYGPADRVPHFLAAAAASSSDESEVWDELFGRLCHQGTVFSASYAALPDLARLSSLQEPDGHVAAVHLAAAILSSTDGPEPAARIRRRFETEIAGLGADAARNLRHAGDDAEFAYGLQALMAFEDGGVWQRSLHFLASGEAELECPSCREELLLNLDSEPFRVASFADSALPATAVTPREPPAETPEGRLLELAHAHHRAAIAARLPSLFGRATCPRCLAAIGVPDALV